MAASLADVRRGAQPSVTTGGPGGTSRPGDGGFWLASLAVALAFALVDTFTTHADRARAGRPIPLWEPAVWEATSVLVILALAPAIMAMVRRFPPRRDRMVAALAAHVAAAAAFSLVHVVAIGVLRSLAYAAMGGRYGPWSPLGNWPYELRKDALIYAGVAATYWLWRERLAHRAERTGGAASASPTIEVRDGARRHFVRPADIDWIEAAGNYAELHLGGRSLLHRSPLRALEARLAGDGFVRIHRSRLVNLAAVSRIDGKPSGDFVVHLRDGRRIEGSRRHRSTLLGA